MENPNRLDSLSWLDKDVQRFKEIGYLIPKEQIKIYSKIRDHWVSGRTVLDVGCSIGVGSNILSHMARHVWGVDINKEALSFANAMYARPNLSFDEYDLENPTDRPLSQFEIVVMSEVIEHLTDPQQGLSSIKRFFSDKLHTVGFITAPNINHPMVAAADSKNPLHMNHWTPGEFYELMIKNFQHVVLYSSYKLDQWIPEETTDGSDTTSRIIIAKVEGVVL